MNDRANHLTQNLSGFTLIELLATISIVSILINYAIPAFSELIVRQQADTIATGIHRQLSLARSTASRTNTTLTFCGSFDGLRCKKSGISKFILFKDENKNAQRDTGEAVYQENGIGLKGSSLSLSASLGRNYIRFDGHGEAKQSGSFVYCPRNKQAKHIRKISVNLAGRAYIRKPSASHSLSC